MVKGIVVEDDTQETKMSEELEHGEKDGIIEDKTEDINEGQILQIMEDQTIGMKSYIWVNAFRLL